MNVLLCQESTFPTAFIFSLSLRSYVTETQLTFFLFSFLWYVPLSGWSCFTFFFFKMLVVLLQQFICHIISIFFSLPVILFVLSFLHSRVVPSSTSYVPDKKRNDIIVDIPRHIFLQVSIIITKRSEKRENEKKYGNGREHGKESCFLNKEPAQNKNGKSTNILL